MESLIREANTKAELLAVDFEKLRQYHMASEKQKLDKKAAKSLVKFLLSKTGEKTDSPVNPELRPKAKAALGVLTYFLIEDEAVQSEFERLSVWQVGRKLKLERHIAEGPEEHRKTVYRLIRVLTTRFKK